MLCYPGLDSGHIWGSDLASSSLMVEIAISLVKTQFAFSTVFSEDGMFLIL